MITLFVLKLLAHVNLDVLLNVGVSLFVGGFKGMDMEKLAKTRMEQQIRAMAPEPVATTKTTIQFGLTTHRVLRTLSIFCHGLLAGFALWHVGSTPHI